jgi:putative phosphoesterase
VVSKATTLAFPRKGSLRLAAVADTHSRPHPRAKERLTELRPDAILHAGDVGDLGVLAALAEIAPVYAVRGNIDGREPSLPDELLLDLTDGERTLRLLLRHIAVSGTRLRPVVRRRAQSCGAKLVVCGHSHIPFIARDNGVTVYNPGSVGPRRFALPILYGTIEIDREGVRLAHFDCETGRPWSPP